MFCVLLGRSPQWNSGRFYPPEIKNWRIIKYVVCVRTHTHSHVRWWFAYTGHMLSCSQALAQAWWRFNPVPLCMYTWLVVVVISAEDIPPSSLYWSGPGHRGVKAKEKEKRFCISMLWEPYCLQNNWLLRCTCAWHHCCERKVGLWSVWLYDISWHSRNI